MQAAAPAPVHRRAGGLPREVPAARLWAAVLAAVPAPGAIALAKPDSPGAAPALIAAAGLALFGLPFAVNSALRFCPILAYSGSKKAAEDVGFYYAANAAGRLMGALLSGLLFQAGGSIACPVGSSAIAGGVRGDRVRAADRGKGAGCLVAMPPRGNAAT